jgi:hypothetical protein
VTLVEDILEKRFTKEMPERLIGDKAYDSDPLDERLQQQGIQLIAPHKSNRKKPVTQDGRAGDTSDVGKWNACLPGCKTFEEFRCAMIVVSTIILPLSCSVA